VEVPSRQPLAGVNLDRRRSAKRAAAPTTSVPSKAAAPTTGIGLDPVSDDAGPMVTGPYVTRDSPKPL
jgi:hypothetical protein